MKEDVSEFTIFDELVRRFERTLFEHHGVLFLLFLLIERYFCHRYIQINLCKVGLSLLEGLLYLVDGL